MNSGSDHSPTIIPGLPAELRAVMDAQEFRDEDDWRAAPSSGFGIFTYWEPRFLAYLERFGNGMEGKAPDLPPHLCQPSEEEFEGWLKRGVGDYTYFAQGRYTGRVKIGRSKQPEYRISQLQHTTQGEESDELVILRDGDLEKGYHRVFRRWSIGNEWFAPHPDIFAEVDRLISLGASNVRPG